MDDFEIYLGDCLEILPKLECSSVDFILTDLPYGVLNKGNKDAKWDCQIPLEPLWREFLRVAKPNAAIVLFSSGMFTAKLMMSQPKLWRYNLVWHKPGRVSGFLNANKMPLRNHEDICVFYENLPTYNPQMVKCDFEHTNHSRGKLEKKATNRLYGTIKDVPGHQRNEKFPTSVLSFPRPHPSIHPTEKNVDLCRWLIRTYTNEGESVLDATMGSGSTGVACSFENRRFIGIEKDEKYFEIAKKRIEEAVNTPKQKDLF